MEQTKYDVFISYSRKDYVDEHNNVIPNNVVSQIKEALEKSNISYWIDEEGIYSGDEYAPILARAIKNCEIFLFVSTKNSNASGWTSNEIATANAFNKKIIPIRVDKSVYNESIILYIAKLDFINYQSNPTRALARMTKSIRGYIDQIANKRIAEEALLEEDRERRERDSVRKQELSQVQNRIVTVERELDHLRGQWKVTSSLYNELKSKEALLLDNPYENNIQQLQELNSELDDGNKEKVLQAQNKRKSFFRRIGGWYVDSDGGERHLLVSLLLKITLTIAVILAFLSYVFFFLESDSFYVTYDLFLFSFLSAAFSIILYYFITWNRIAYFLFILCLWGVSAIPIINNPTMPFSKGMWLLIPIVVTVLLFTSKYKGKYYYEQTTPIIPTLKNKQGERKFGKILIISCLPFLLAFLFIIEVKPEPYLKTSMMDSVVEEPDDFEYLEMRFSEAREKLGYWAMKENELQNELGRSNMKFGRNSKRVKGLKETLMATKLEKDKAQSEYDTTIAIVYGQIDMARNRVERLEHEADELKNKLNDKNSDFKRISKERVAIDKFVYVARIEYDTVLSRSKRIIGDDLVMKYIEHIDDNQSVKENH